jgi:GntR family transcriptional regulator
MASVVHAQIIDLINDGMQPGDQLPTEPELAATFSVSRATVREALKLLEQDGVVHAMQGRGRFVSPLGALNVERPITRYESITEMLESLGYTVTNSVLAVEETPATERVAEALDIAVGEPVIKLVRLRLDGDEPLVFSVNMIVRSALPGPLAYRDWSASLTAALEAHGHQIDTAAARISAENLPAQYERYGLEAGPWLLVEETCVTREGQRVLFSLDYHRGEKIAFNVLRRR